MPGRDKGTEIRKINGEGNHRAQFNGPKSHTGWRTRHFLVEGKEKSVSLFLDCRIGSDLGSILEKNAGMQSTI